MKSSIQGVYLLFSCVWMILSLVFLLIQTRPELKNTPYQIVKRYLTLAFFLMGISPIFTILRGAVENGKMEVLNFFNLIIYFCCFLGIIISLLILYNSPLASKKNILKETLFPFLSATFYGMLTLLKGETRVFSLSEFIQRLPFEPILMARGLLLAVILVELVRLSSLFFQGRRVYLEIIGRHGSASCYLHSEWISRLYFWLIGLSAFLLIASLYPISYLNILAHLLITCTYIFYMVQFINQQHLFTEIARAFELEKKEGIIHPILSDTSFPTKQMIDELKDHYKMEPFNVADQENWKLKVQEEEKILEEKEIGFSQNKIAIEGEKRGKEIKEEEKEERRKSPAPAKKKTTTPDLNFLPEIEKWLQQKEKSYLSNGFTLEDLAQTIHINKALLSEFINQYYHMNFNMWINSLRIKEAICLITDEKKHLTLTEIAYQTGFSDLPAMSNVFKKFKGVSPSVYRTQILLAKNRI